MDTISVKQIALASMADEWADDLVHLKIDVQGYERAVLAGVGTKLMSNVVCAELELSFQQLYEGGPLAGEMLELMRQHGFSIAGIAPGLIDERTDELLQADCLFVRAAV